MYTMYYYWIGVFILFGIYLFLRFFAVQAPEKKKKPKLKITYVIKSTSGFVKAKKEKIVFKQSKNYATQFKAKFFARLFVYFKLENSPSYEIITFQNAFKIACANK